MFPNVNDVLVELIVENGPRTEEADSQFTTDPVLPLSVNVPELEVEHTLPMLETVPPTVASFIITVVVETEVAQGPTVVVAVYTPDFADDNVLIIGF